MIISRLATLVLIAVMISVSVFAGDEKPLTAEETIETLDWLAGSWEGDMEGNRFEAHYTTPEGGIILSVNKEFLEDRPCYIEFEKFYTVDDKVLLTPYPGGKQSVSFTLVSYNPDVKRARFENLDHDFPTDITYELVSDDSLKIRVAGPYEGRRKTFTVNLVKRQ